MSWFLNASSKVAHCRRTYSTLTVETAWSNPASSLSCLRLQHDARIEANLRLPISDERQMAEMLYRTSVG